MGDVFDAMNRARRESGEEPDGGAPKPERPNSPIDSGKGEGSEGGGLPFDGMQVASVSEEDAKDPQHQESVNFRKQTAAAVGSDAPAPDRMTEPEAKSADRGHEPVALIDEHATKQAIEDRADEDDDNSKLNGYSKEVVVHHDRASVITEQYRAIRTQILARGKNRKLQTHVITSSAPGEGKSVTTINLGIIFSELRNQKTLLVECDLRRPTFGKLLDRDNHDGMVQLLRGEESDLDHSIHSTVYNNLDVIPAGGRDSLHSTELLSSPRMAQILDRLRDRYDHIFIDSPPVVSVTDAAILGSMCDETLMVVRLNKTPTEIVDRAKRLLRANNCEVTGVILTHLKLHMPRYLYRYSYGYGYGYGSKYS